MMSVFLLCFRRYLTAGQAAFIWGTVLVTVSKAEEAGGINFLTFQSNLSYYASQVYLCTGLVFMIIIHLRTSAPPHLRTSVPPYLRTSVPPRYDNDRLLQALSFLEDTEATDDDVQAMIFRQQLKFYYCYQLYTLRSVCNDKCEHWVLVVVIIGNIFRPLCLCPTLTQCTEDGGWKSSQSRWYSRCPRSRKIATTGNLSGMCVSNAGDYDTKRPHTQPSDTTQSHVWLVCLFVFRNWSEIMW